MDGRFSVLLLYIDVAFEPAENPCMQTDYVY